MMAKWDVSDACRNRREARDAGRSIMNGIRAMGRLRL